MKSSVILDKADSLRTNIEQMEISTVCEMKTKTLQIVIEE